MAVADVDGLQLLEESHLFGQLYQPLRRFAGVVAPREMDPDDLLQEAIARVLTKHRLTELNQPEPYLRRTMVNLASNHRRYLARTRRAISRLGASTDQARDIYPSDIEDLLRLPPLERAVLYLSEVEGFRYGEIGSILDCSEAAARKRALRARRRLQKALVEEVANG